MAALTISQEQGKGHFLSPAALSTRAHMENVHGPFGSANERRQLVTSVAPSIAGRSVEWPGVDPCANWTTWPAKPARRGSTLPGRWYAARPNGPNDMTGIEGDARCHRSPSGSMQRGPSAGRRATVQSQADAAPKSGPASWDP